MYHIGLASDISINAFLYIGYQLKFHIGATLVACTWDDIPTSLSRNKLLSLWSKIKIKESLIESNNTKYVWGSGCYL